MSRTISRKAKSARKTVAAQGKARKVQNARKKTGSALDAVMSWLPFTEQQLHTAFLACILGIAAVTVWVVAAMAGLPAMAHRQLALVASDAGFEVRRVDVRGVEHMNELKVYEHVLAQRDRAMPLVDIDALRDELLTLSWVKDARVSRQLPDTLVIDIVERSPHAVLRRGSKYVLIDDTGHALEPVSRDRARKYLIVTGPGASRQVERLTALLETAPAIKPQVREAEWLGNRRWNLTFRTGQVLALPEGEKPSANALVTFARLDGTNRLLGGKVAAFDMRAPDRIYLRVPGRDQQEAALSAGAVARKPAQEKN